MKNLKNAIGITVITGLLITSCMDDKKNNQWKKYTIDNFNKKAIYIMIREMTDVKTSKITQITNTFRKIYPKIQEEVLTRGHIDNLRYTGSLV